MTVTLAFVFVVVILSALLLSSTNNNNTEHFNDNSNAIDNMLGMLSLKNNIDDPDTDYSLPYDYNERLATIGTGMVLYYTAFSYTSYPKEGRTWYNIAPHHDKMVNKCAVEDTHATFTMTPSFSRENGFSFGSSSIVLPKAFQSGINGNASFTIFMTIQVNAVDASSTKEYTLLNIPANTMNNHGLSISINNLVNIGHTIGTNILLRHGSQSVTAMDPSSNKPLITLNPNGVLFLVVRKTNMLYDMYLYQQMDAITSTMPSFQKIVKQWRIDPSEDVLYSNKEIRFNPNTNIYGRIYNLGFYSKSVDEHMLNIVFMHSQTELHKSNHVISQLANRMQDLQTKLKQAAACPFNSKVCSDCAMVNNWNSFGFMQQGTPACFESVDKFCSQNPKHSHCECWLNESSPYCASFISTVRGIHRQESCSGEPEKKEKLPPPPPPPINSVPAPVAASFARVLLDNIYIINMDDLQAYEAIIPDSDKDDDVVVQPYKGTGLEPSSYQLQLDDDDEQVQSMYGAVSDFAS